MARLRDEHVLTIYRWYEEGAPVRIIARHFDITESYVHALLKGKTHKGLYEMYFGKGRKRA